MTDTSSLKRVLLKRYPKKIKTNFDYPKRHQDQDLSSEKSALTTGTCNTVYTRSKANGPVVENEPPTTHVAIETLILLAKCTWLLLVWLVKLILPTPEKSVRGEITLITGAGHGIGRELAYQYASNGATVVCVDINQQNNEETVKEIERMGYPKAHCYVCDVAKRDDVFDLAVRIQKEVGDVSILINNAGILACVPFFESSQDTIERIFNVNVLGNFWTIQAFLPKMLELNRGHIVALSSCCGLIGVKYLTAYSASKFAVRGFMSALRDEIGAKGNINFTTVYPHIVDTGLCKQPVIRFPGLTPMVKPTDAAKHIIWAQRRNISETSVPSVLMVINSVCRIFPESVGDAVMDFFGIYVKPDA